MHGFSIGRNVICSHKIFYIIQQTYKEEVCARFWVKGFKVKVDQDKSSLYLKRASSLVLTRLMSPGGRRYDTRTRWPCWTLGSTGLTTGGSLTSTSPMLESRPIGHVFKRIGTWIYMYNLLILMLETNFFSPKKKIGNEISTAMC